MAIRCDWHLTLTKEKIMANKFGKTRAKDEPYAVYKSIDGWEWRVLKTYKQRSSELKDPYARWFVAATSPMMHDGSFEMGDTYVKDILEYGQLFNADAEWRNQYDVRPIDEYFRWSD